MNVAVRTAQLEDYGSVSVLLEEADGLHRDHLPHLFRMPDGPIREPDYWKGLFEDENIGLFVAERDGELLGFVHGEIKETAPVPNLVPQRFAYVDSISVKAEHRGRGIGKILMEFLHRWAATKGATSITLNVYEFNEDAILFYEELGYKSLSRRMIKLLDG